MSKTAKFDENLFSLELNSLSNCFPLQLAVNCDQSILTIILCKQQQDNGKQHLAVAFYDIPAIIQYKKSMLIIILLGFF